MKGAALRTERRPDGPGGCANDLRRLWQESAEHLADDQAAGTRWKGEVELFIAGGLGKDGEPILERFRKISYSVGMYRMGDPENPRRFQAARLGGYKKAMAEVEVAIIALEVQMPSDRGTVPREVAGVADTVFLVHGHDDGAKEGVARWIQGVHGSAPTILHEQPNAGRTLIEKFEGHAARAAFAVILLTPDDVGRAVTADTDNARPRQNVVFEMGYFFGLLGRGRVAVLNAGVEKPSDADGIAYIPFPDSNWKSDLARELRAAGLTLNNENI